MVTIKTDEIKGSKAQEYVTIPAEDSLGFPFPTVRINLQEFEPGKQYLLEAELAFSVKDRIAAYNRGALRQMQSNRDLRAVRIADGNSPNEVK